MKDLKEFLNKVETFVSSKFNLDSALSSKIIIVHQSELVNKKASFNGRVIKISDSVVDDNFKSVLLHEVAHLIEFEQEKKRTPNRFLNLTDFVLQSGAYSVDELDDNEKELFYKLNVLPKVWTDPDYYDEAVEDIYDLCKIIYKSVSPASKWIKDNVDKIDRRIDFYENGGHTDEWRKIADELEKEFSVKIENYEE